MMAKKKRDILSGVIVTALIVCAVAAQAVALYDLFGAVLDAGRSLSAMLLFIQQDGGAVRARISAS